MPFPDTLPGYLWMRLPLVLMFVNGYLMYRLLVVTDLTHVIVCRSLQRSNGDIRMLFLYIISVAAGLSLFIPNAVTVLTLLPVLKTIREDLGCGEDRRIITALTLSVIYGANIGGMGSLIGSPANLILIGELDLYEVPGREQISFFNWFLWAIPLVVIMTAAAWGLVTFLAAPRTGRKGRFQWNNAVCAPGLTPEQRSGLHLFFFFIGFWITEAILRERVAVFLPFAPLAALLFFVLFCWLAMGRRSRAGKRPLLRPGALVQGFPRRGFLFLGLLLLVILLVRLFRIDESASALYHGLIRPDAPLGVLLLITILSVIFLTEMFSNTLISTAFFPIAYFAATARGMSPLMLMIAVSVASTCAFMTPVATPCNALAFGEMKGTSLSRMFLLGLVLNLAGAAAMAAWLQFVIPRIYE